MILHVEANGDLVLRDVEPLRHEAQVLCDADDNARIHSFLYDSNYKGHTEVRDTQQSAPSTRVVGVDASGSLLVHDAGMLINTETRGSCAANYADRYANRRKLSESERNNPDV